MSAIFLIFEVMDVSALKDIVQYKVLSFESCCRLAAPRSLELYAASKEEPK